MSYHPTMAEYGGEERRPSADSQFGRAFEYRPAGAPQFHLTPMQQPVPRANTPYLTVDTSTYGGAPRPHPSGGDFYTPSPSEYVSPAVGHAQGHQYHGAGHSTNYTYTPPATSPQDTGYVQYQKQAEEPMFGFDAMDEAPRANAAHYLTDEYGHQSEAQPMDRSASFGSVHSATAPVYGHIGSQFEAPAMQVDQQLASVPRTTYLGNGMAINNGIAFLPNHLLTHPSSHHWSVGGTPSSFHVDGPDGSYDSERSFMTASSASGYGMPAYPPGAVAMTSPAPAMTDNSGYGQMYNGNGAHMANPLLVHGFHPHSSAPRQVPVNSFTSEYEVGPPAWSQQPQQLPSMNHHATAGMDANEILLYARDGLRMSYKDIKQRFGFQEKESTLRGRHRTLTKDKADRVRKPVWSEKDNKLLREAVVKKLGIATVKRIRTEEDLNKLGGNIGWKEVGDFIRKNGGTYGFAPATAKKQYVKLFCSGVTPPPAVGHVAFSV